MFTKFVELPIELRLEIWGHAAQHPQIIGLCSGKNSHSLSGTKARCPLLRVSKEARDEALKLKKDFNKRLKRRDGAKVYVNLEVDTLWLADFEDSGRDDIRKRPVKNIRSIAIAYHDLTALVEKKDILLKMNLKEIVVILQSETIGENDEAVFIEPRSDIPPPSQDRWHNKREVKRFAKTWEDDACKQKNLIRAEAKLWLFRSWRIRFDQSQLCVTHNKTKTSQHCPHLHLKMQCINLGTYFVASQ